MKENKSNKFLMRFAVVRRWLYKRREMVISFGVLFIGILGACLISCFCYATAEIGTSILRDINIAMISMVATAFGLYVTAYIFLNDSLKSRIREDATLKEAVDSVFEFCRKKMVIYCIFTVLAILLEIGCNIVLGQPSTDANTSIENLRLSLRDWRWYLFIVVTLLSVLVVAWIIYSSLSITSGERLIRNQAKQNMLDERTKLLRVFYDLKKGSENHPDKSETNFDKLNGMQIIEKFAKKKYALENAYVQVNENEQKNKENEKKNKAKAEDKRVTTSSVNDGHSEKVANSEHEVSNFLILLGKNVRLMEVIIKRICDNNIDKSIMNNDFVFSSMESGFVHLYAGAVTGNNIDVRDKNRFFDFLKYEIITDYRFKNIPFDNEEVESVFSKALGMFESGDSQLPFSQKNEKIQNYKEQMLLLIGEFFEAYEHLIKFRDAALHYEQYNGGRTKDKNDEQNENILRFSETLKRALIDRFTSFVKINDMNLGNSTFDKGWFNYSDLSDSSFTHSSFKYARMENAVMKRCDFSTCKFVLADASNTDFTGCSFNYSDLTGMDLSECILNNAQMDYILLRDTRLDRYHGGLTQLSSAKLNELKNDKLKYQAEARKQDAELLTPKIENEQTQVDNVEKLINDGSGWLYKADVEVGGQEYEKRLKDLRGGKVPFDGIVHYFISKSVLAKAECAVANSISIDCGILTTEGSSVVKNMFADVLGILEPVDKKPLIGFVPYRKYTKINDKVLAFVKERRINEGERKTEREAGHGKVCFYAAKLIAASLNNVSMKSTDFSYVRMEKASFRESDLSGSDMYYTEAPGVLFIRTNLNDLDAYKSDFAGCNFTEAQLLDARFVDCKLTGANFGRTVMLNVVIYCTKEKDENKVYLEAFLEKSKETGRNDLHEFTERLKDNIPELKEEIDAVDCEFASAIITGSKILNINLMRTNFTSIVAKNVLLFNNVMHWCDFTNSDFTNSLCFGVSFRHSDFTAADFSRSKIVASEMSDCNLSNSNFISVKFEKVIFDEANLSGCNMSDAEISCCTFTKCNLRGLITSRTAFKNVIFIDVDFSNVIGLDEAVFENCEFAFSNGIDDNDEDSLCLTQETVQPGVYLHQTKQVGIGLNAYSSDGIAKN